MKLDEEPKCVYKNCIFLSASVFLAPEIDGSKLSVTRILQHKIINWTEMD